MYIHAFVCVWEGVCVTSSVCADGEWHWLVETWPWWLVAVLVDVCVSSGLNGSSSLRVPQVPPAPEDPPELQVLTGRKAPQVE